MQKQQQPLLNLANDMLQEFMKQKADLETKISEIRKQESEAIGSEKYDLFQKRADIRNVLNGVDEALININNGIKAVKNGGTISLSFTDKKGKIHSFIPDFRNIKASDILFDEKTILLQEAPAYIPVLNEDYLKYYANALDAIRIDENSFLLSIKKYSEEGGFYVLVTLDQLVLISEYYLVKQKAENIKQADDLTKRNIDYWFQKPEEYREKFLMQKGFYHSLPAKIKKQITQEKYESLTWQEREKIYIPIKSYGAKKLKVYKLEENKMWGSLHAMYERFVNPEATMPKPRVANKEVFDYWENLRQWIKYKSIDLKIQREELKELSQIRTAALETSFGYSNTNDQLKNNYGILVKRQNGDKITPIEISEIEQAWKKVNNFYGGLKTLVNNLNFKISHTGNKYVFASNAIGVFVPTMNCIAVSNKFGQDQFEDTLAHELAHLIDYTIGKWSAKRFASDDFESTAGQIAINFRNNLNKKTDSDYLNSSKECFARAFEQYYALSTRGEKAKTIYTFGAKKQDDDPYITNDNFVSLDSFKNKIEPLIKKLLEENKEIFEIGFIPEQQQNINKITDMENTIITDPIEKQKIINSILEGEMILKSGKKISGDKYSDDELQAILNSVNNSKIKIGMPVKYTLIEEYKKSKLKPKKIEPERNEPKSESKTAFKRGDIILSDDQIYLIINTQIHLNRLDDKMKPTSVYFDDEQEIQKILKAGKKIAFANTSQQKQLLQGYFSVNDLIELSNFTPSIPKEVEIKLTPSNKELWTIFKKIVGNDDLRPQFTGINFDESGATATDAHKLIFIPGKVEKQGIFDEYGSQIHAKYPDYKAVIPVYKNEDLINVDLKALYYLSKLYIKSGIKKYINQIVLKYQNGLIGINPAFLFQVTESMLKLKNDGWKAYLTQPSKAILFIHDNGTAKTSDDVIALQMPVMLSEIKEPGFIDIDYKQISKLSFDFTINSLIENNKPINLSDEKKQTKQPKFNKDKKQLKSEPEPPKTDINQQIKTLKEARPVKGKTDAPVEERSKDQIKKDYENEVKEVEESYKDKFASLTEGEVILIGLKLNQKRSLYSQFVDNASDNKKRLSPTPENLLRWMNNPGKFDLIGVDTFERTDATKDYKKLISKQKIFNLFGIKV